MSDLDNWNKIPWRLDFAVDWDEEEFIEVEVPAPYDGHEEPEAEYETIPNPDWKDRRGSGGGEIVYGIFLICSVEFHNEHVDDVERTRAQLERIVECVNEMAAGGKAEKMIEATKYQVDHYGHGYSARLFIAMTAVEALIPKHTEKCEVPKQEDK